MMNDVKPTRLMSAEYLFPERSLLMLVKPQTPTVDLPAWAADNMNIIETTLLTCGGILFRDTGLLTQSDFERFLDVIFPQTLHYLERSTPRTKLSERVYTSTEYPASLPIALHNESSYSSTWPGKICFYCLKPADQQGETPLADVRNVYKRIAPEIVDRFVTKGWMLVRNYKEGVGLDWQDAFQTTERSVVEQYCRSAQIEWDWIGSNSLRTRQVRRAVVKHPKTGETVWFSHVSFWHVSSFEPETRKAMLKVFREEELPYNTYYGDGSPIEDAVIAQIRQAYEEEKVMFPWQHGDVLLLDNMLVAHGRNPYKGTRKILTAMAEPQTSDIS
jgi:alpha-ketoglutarate-dependent taurine dioxygenase